MSNLKKFLLGIIISVSICLPVYAADLTIGVLGVMSGPAASWGLVNKYSAEATANMYNAKGGVDIGGTKYKIKIVSIDEKNDPKLAVAGAERLTQRGIKYIIGPNVDTTAASIVPVMEKAKAINFPYAFSRDLYQKPKSNSILGMIASYQAGPTIYKYLKDQKGIKSVSFVARNEADPLRQQQEGVAGAKQVGLKVINAKATYEPGTVDFFPVVSGLVKRKPGLLVLSGVAPGDAPLLIKAARQLGYKGFISTETAQDIKILNEAAGSSADGFISVGGASTPAISSSYMNEFRKEYIKVAGEWNDEAGTKVYALEMILRNLQKAGKGAIKDVELFKAQIDKFDIRNPFIKSNERLVFTGKTYFGQNRQLGIPMVVNEVRNGKFETLFIGSVN